MNENLSNQPNVTLEEVIESMFGGRMDTHTEKKEKTNHSIVGREYFVSDNSYAKDKTHNSIGMGLRGKTYKVISEPYRVDVTEELPFSEGETKFVTMVDVKSYETGFVYSVMFMENGLY